MYKLSLSCTISLGTYKQSLIFFILVSWWLNQLSEETIELIKAILPTEKLGFSGLSEGVECASSLPFKSRMYC